MQLFQCIQSCVTVTSERVLTAQNFKTERERGKHDLYSSLNSFPRKPANRHNRRRFVQWRASQSYYKVEISFSPLMATLVAANWMWDRRSLDRPNRRFMESRSNPRVRHLLHYPTLVELLNPLTSVDVGNLNSLGQTSLEYYSLTASKKLVREAGLEDKFKFEYRDIYLQRDIAPGTGFCIRIGVVIRRAHIDLAVVNAHATHNFCV